MSNVIDNRVVQMQFDNQQFERGVKQSMDSLNQLDGSLKELDKSTGAKSLTTALNNIQSSLSKINPTRWAWVQQLNKDIMSLGRTITSKLLQPLSIMKEGGLARALNIEQAKFQFEGLGIDVEEAMASATKAVNDTAYGLDEAAKAASMLTTSGVQAGDELTTALTAISGVTAQVNGNYSDIANIFTDIAAAGRVTGDSLTRLSYRGLNAAEVLGQAMGKSAADVKKLASQGQISFKQFYEAMYSKYADHAYKANETYTGSLDNLHAALKKIGADFGQYKLKEMVAMHNSLRVAINKVRKELTPLADAYGKLFHIVVQFATTKIDAFNAAPIRKIIEGLSNVLIILINIAKQVKLAIQEMFPNAAIKSFDQIATAFRDFTERIQLSAEGLETFKNIFKGFIAFFDIIGQVILGIGKAIFPAVNSLSDLFGVIVLIFGKLGEGLVIVDQWIRKNNFITASLNTVKNVLISVLAVIIGLALKVADLVKQLKNSEVVVQIISKLSGAFNKLKSIFSGFVKSVSDASGGSKAEQFKNSKSGGDSSGGGIFGWLTNQLHNLTAVIKKVIGEITPAKVIIAAFVAFIAGLAIAFAVAANKLSNGVKQTGNSLNNFWNAYMKFTKKISDKGEAAKKKEKFRHFIEVAGLLTALAFALKGLAAQPLPNIITAVVLMGAIIYELWAITKDVAKLPNKEKAEKNLKAIKGIALIMVATGVALAIAAKQNWGQLAAAGFAMGICMQAVIHVIKTIASIDTPKITTTIDTMGKMSAVVASFPVIARALKKLNGMDPGSIVAAAAGMSGCILAVGKTIDIISNIDGEGVSWQKVAAILAVCVGANLIGQALAKAATQNWKQLAIAAVAITVTMGAMTGIVWALSKIGSDEAQNALAAAGALAIASVSLIFVAQALSKLSYYNWEDMWRSLIAMNATVIVMGGVLAALTALSIGSEGIGAVVLLAVAASVIAMGYAMELASKGVLMISQALQILSNVDLKSLSLSLVYLAGAINEFPVLKIIGLAAACLIGGNGFLAFARGIQEFSNADLSNLANNVSTLFDAIAQSTTSFVEVGANLTALGVGLNVIAEAISKVGFAMVGVGIGLALAGVGVMAAGAGLRIMAPALEIMQGLDWVTLGSGLAAVSDSIGKLAISGVAISLVSKGLMLGAVALGAIALECWGFSNLNLNAIAKGLSSIAVGGLKLGGAGVVMALGAAGVGAMALAVLALGKAVTTGAQLISTGVKITVNSLLLLKQVGSNVIAGFAQGITSGFSTVAKIGASLGATVVDAICKVLDIHSPSGALRKVGEFTGSGFILGIADMMDEAEKSGKSLGLSALAGTEGLSDLFTKAGASLGLDFSGGFEGVINSLIGGVAKNYSRTGKNGMPSDVAAKMSTTGLDGLINSTKDLLGINLDLDKVLGDITSSAGGAGSALESFGDSAGKAGKGAKSAKDEMASFVEKMEQSFNILEEFDLGLDEENPLTPDKLLANMKSNIDGMAQWSSEMVSLAGKMSQGLYKKLADMGPQGYKYVHAFTQMTEEQLQQVNEYYAQSLVIPTSVTAQIYGGMAEAAQNAYTGFINGLNIPQMQQDGVTMATTFLDGLTGEKGLDSHSPSRKTLEQGVNAGMGFKNGLENPTVIGTIQMAVEDICKTVFNTFDKMLTEDKFQKIGRNITDGLKEGIEDGEGDLDSAVKRMCDKIVARTKSKEGLWENSPSKIFRQIGQFVSEGLALGITDNVGMVEGSVSTMTKTTIDNMRDAVNTIKTIVDTDMDVEPVIRPVVDLSDIQNGANSINSLMGMNFGSNVTMPAASFMQTSQLISTADNSNVVDAVVSLKSDVTSLKDAMTRIKIVLDTGTMVGAMAPDIDRQMGVRRMYAERGIIR